MLFVASLLSVLLVDAILTVSVCLVCLCVLQFLEKGGISELCRENFTFSTKVNIGRFYEQQTTSDDVRKLPCIR